MEEEEHRNKWEDWSDEGVDEWLIEPDFIIDRPPTPEFIPNEKGIDKET